MLAERQGMSGVLTITLRNRQGHVLEHRKACNLITNAGKTLIAQCFTGELTIAALHIAVGSDDTAVQDTDTDLGAPEREELATTTVDGHVARVEATLMGDGTTNEITLREAGIRIHFQSGQTVLYNRVTFPVITMTGNMDLTLAWEVNFSTPDEQQSAPTAQASS